MSIDALVAKVQAYDASLDRAWLRERLRHGRAGAPRAAARLRSSYIEHPLAVAEILADLEMDRATIAAALLHDVVEDTTVTSEEVAERFGTEIATLVDGVTKLTSIPYQAKEDAQVENLRKMLLAMAKDIRVIIIKLADRLHNMRTLASLPPAKQQTIARETLDIYAPIAHRLGIWRMQMGSRRSRAALPRARRLSRDRRPRREETRRARGRGRKRHRGAQGAVRRRSASRRVSGRPKHFYSIHKKMEKGRDFSTIYDLTAVRVIVDSVKDCYGALGVVHSIWKPLPGRFKDYIAMPKPNMYQSLHTTVVGPGGDPLEVQIRTLEMHRTSEYGIAAHWRYKEGGKNDNFEEKLTWLRSLLEWQNDMRDSRMFMENLKLDLFDSQVFVFSPKGDVFSLPAGATPLDFAYQVHTDIGNRCVGAKVNGKIVPLDFRSRTATSSRSW